MARTEPDTIGHAVSSGCIRLLNEDVYDLYNRVPIGAVVTVQQGERRRHAPIEESLNEDLF
jgi:lipoprotein-anchoring transpeptidase ErfK/SrfK